jgi:hypothetical protein
MSLQTRVVIRSSRKVKRPEFERKLLLCQRHEGRHGIWGRELRVCIEEHDYLSRYFYSAIGAVVPSVWEVSWQAAWLLARSLVG